MSDQVSTQLIDEAFKKHGAISIAFLMNKLKISVEAATRLFYKIEKDRASQPYGNSVQFPDSTFQQDT